MTTYLGTMGFYGVDLSGDNYSHTGFGERWGGALVGSKLAEEVAPDLWITQTAPYNGGAHSISGVMEVYEDSVANPDVNYLLFILVGDYTADPDFFPTDLQWRDNDRYYNAGHIKESKGWTRSYNVTHDVTEWQSSLEPGPAPGFYTDGDLNCVTIDDYSGHTNQANAGYSRDRVISNTLSVERDISSPP